MEGLVHTWVWWGVVPLVILLPLVIVSMIMLHRYRDCQVISQRSYLFLQLQNIGLLFSGIVFNSDSMTGEKHLCDFFIWSTTISFSLFALPVFMRVWIYCFRYYLTQERKRARPSQYFMSRLHMMKPQFLLRLWGGLFTVITLLPVLLSIISAAKGDPAWMPRDMPLCSWELGFVGASVGYALTFISLSYTVLAVIFLWKSQDVYYIKKEMKITLAIWIFACSITIINSAGMTPSGVPFTLYVPPNTTGTIGLVLTAFITGPWLIRHARRERRLKESETDLVKCLQMPAFRQDFFEFMCLQFSIENLLFWEDVQAYRLLPPGSLEQSNTAMIIHKKYIEEGAPCQVNIEDQTRSSINNNISSSVTSELFSVAEREVFSLMKFHSFPLFLRHRRSSIGDGSSSFNSAAAVLIVTGSDYDETEIELA
eukprot:TRINITY_DN2521_c0_g1_i8.p1 TRINITY_DN2521_c0_g1~~TRINITY_DN2521_c0_g1_i8.p1  ORF type:complete len:425 (+),score=61.54 TRINITY_DN2521_c0_g1_i8:1170-2444(+)